MVRSLDRRTFAAAAILTAMAGAVDGIGFLALGGFFVSFMSGNTTRASVGVAEGDWSSAALAGLLIAAFVAGVMAGTALPAGRGSAATRILVLVIVAVALAAAGLALGWTWAAGAVLAVGMGAKNTVFSRGGASAFGITYMTGALVKVGEGLVEALRGGERMRWARPFAQWASIAVGAALGAFAYSTVGAAALWALAAVLTALVLIPPTRRWLRG